MWEERSEWFNVPAFLSISDLSPLLTNNSLPCATIPVQNFTLTPEESIDDGPCSRYALQNSIHYVLTFQSKIFALWGVSGFSSRIYCVSEIE